MLARQLGGNYRRLKGARRFSSFCGLFKEHRVVAFYDCAIKCPSFALAHKVRGCGGCFFGHASLFISKLNGMRNGLECGGGHVEQHFTQMGAAFYAANVLLNCFSPTRTQRATNQTMHAGWRLVTFGVGRVGHVGDDIVNLQLIVHREANVQTVNGFASSFRPLTGNNERVGFNVCQRGFDVPKAVFSLKAGIDHGSRV